ncbi:MAG: hypothetical protein R3C52_06250 [Hyphomonadaceae bacterium]
MRSGIALAALAAGTIAGAGAANAENGVAVSAGLGTTGGAISAEAALNDYFVLRGGYNYFKYGMDDEYDDIAYDGDLDLSTLGAFVDLHPFGGAFMLSGGAYFGDKALKMHATPTENVEIGDATYTPAQVGTLNMKANLEKAAPFVGLGWDTAFTGEGPWGFRFVAGAMFTGSPDVNLTSTGGTLSDDPNFLAEVAREEQNLRDDVDDYEVYPVIEAAVSFRF